VKKKKRDKGPLEGNDLLSKPRPAKSKKEHDQAKRTDTILPRIIAWKEAKAGEESAPHLFIGRSDEVGVEGE
jgi:hypothetical protein